MYIHVAVFENESQEITLLAKTFWRSGRISLKEDA